MKQNVSEAEMIRVLKKATEDEDNYFPGVLGNPVTFAGRWGLPLSKSYRTLRARELANQRRRMSRMEPGPGSGPVDITLRRGVWLKSFPEASLTPRFLTYSKGREARVYQIDCEFFGGTYWLKQVREVGPRVRGAKKDLTSEEARPVISEVLAHLRANGYSADVSPYVNSK